MKIKYLLILFTLTVSCKTQENGLFEFDPRTLKENNLTLSEIADEVTYIPLDNSFPLGTIYGNIKFINNSIYLSERYIGILVFNRNGKILRKIGNKGRGPGEYLYNYLFTVDEKTESVYILDERAIKVYSKDGHFLRRISMSEYGDNIQTLELYNSYVFVFNSLQMGESKYNWIVLDTLDNLIKKKERSTPPFKSGWGGSYGTYKFENKLFYWNTYNDTVYSILPDLSYKASFVFCPGDHRVPRSEFSPFKQQLIDYMHIQLVFETRRFLAITYLYKRRTFVLIDKRNSNTFLSYLESEGSSAEFRGIGGIENDIDGGRMFFPESYFLESNREYLVGLLNPYQIKSHVQSNEFKNSTPKYPDKKKELEKLAASLKETDNPVLMLVSLKK